MIRGLVKQLTLRETKNLIDLIISIDLYSHIITYICFKITSQILFKLGKRGELGKEMGGV